MGNYTNNIYSRLGKKQNTQKDEILQKIKNSLLRDELIEVCIDIHKHNPDGFVKWVDLFEETMAELLKTRRLDVYGAYRVISEKRLIRFEDEDDDCSYENMDKTIIRMCAELSKYRQEIVVGNLLSQVRVIEVS